MPGVKLSLVEGSFEELSQELAEYLDKLNASTSTSSDIEPLIKDKEADSIDKDAVLKKLVTASSALNAAPERELQAAYNLLIHLVSQAPNPEMYMPKICANLTSPITSSPQNGSGIALGILSTLFNTVPPDDETRFHVLLAIITLVRNSGNFETLKAQLKTLDSWVTEWELDADDQRKLFLAISETAADAGEDEDSYIYLLKALRTIQDSAADEEARTLSLRALKSALLSPTHFDFQDLTALDSIQALRKSDPTVFELLELFASEQLDDFQDFKEGNSSFLAEQNLDEEVLDRKMRLLTLASLAAQASQTRTLPYAQIAKALQIPSEDVEMWVIDVIRAGLVEGKLSQQTQTFLIHRSTYRVFGDNQWREVASRLETWRSSLVNVLGVIRAQKEEYIREKEAEISGQANGGYRPNMRQRNAIEVD